MTMSFINRSSKLLSSMLKYIDMKPTMIYLVVCTYIKGIYVATIGCLTFHLTKSCDVSFHQNHEPEPCWLIIKGLELRQIYTQFMNSIDPTKDCHGGSFRGIMLFFRVMLYFIHNASQAFILTNVLQTLVYLIFMDTL